VGRRSLKEQRITEILDAFEQCLKQKGLQSTTLDNIAQEANMARRMVRHYVGNRSDLIELGVARIIDKFQRSVFNVIDQKESENRIQSALDYLFSENFNTHPATQTVAALLPVSFYDVQVKYALKSIYDSFQKGIDTELKMTNPNADDEKRQRVAYSIMCLSFGGGWMLNLGFDITLNQNNKLIAQGLIEQL